MKRKKIFLFLILALVAIVLLSAVACVQESEEYKKELKIEYFEETKVIRLQAPWADNISFSLYYGTDANGQNVITIEGVSQKDSYVSIENYLNTYGGGNYFVVVIATDSEGFFVKETLSFEIKSTPPDDGNQDDEKDPPVENGKVVEGKLKSVYYFKANSNDDLKINLFNSSGVKTLHSNFMDLHSAWTYDGEEHILSIKASHLQWASAGAKFPLEITYNDDSDDEVYMQITDTVPMDVVKGGLSESNIYSDNVNGIIKITPIIGFDLYLGYDGVTFNKPSSDFVNAVVVDGVQLPWTAYSLSRQTAKISFSYANDNILKLSHGLHFFEIYTNYGRSEVWVYLRKGIDRYPQKVSIDCDSDFPNVYISWDMLRDDAKEFAVHIGDSVYSDKEYPQLFDGNNFDATGKIKYLDNVKVSATYDDKAYVSLDDDTLKINVDGNVIKNYLSYDESFEFLGVKHNYYIRNFDEFKDMIFYALIYYSQLKDSANQSKYDKMLRFYIDPRYASSVKELDGYFDMALKYFNEAVKETHEIKLVYDNIYELNLKVLSTCIPTDVGREPVSQTIKENAFNNFHYSQVGRGDGYDGFAVNSYQKTAQVKYSEELYMALERGIRPLPQKGSNAEKIYEIAKKVLTKIIDDGMDDYQKVHAMADWLSCNVSYNWALDEEVGKIPSTSEEYNKFYSYSEFYLEGVFLNRLAVCNGYAKAMSLMCGIEGIKCYKIKGGSGANNAVVGENYSQHAWNKIGIDGKWYVVDTTWANEKYSLDGGDTVEVLKHNTLFMTEKESGNYKGGAHYEMYSGNYSGCYAGESYDIFANTFFNYGGNAHDMVIDDAKELEILLSYMLENKASSLTANSYCTIDVRCNNYLLGNYLQELREQKSELFKNFIYTVKYNTSYGNMASIVMRRV